MEINIKTDDLLLFLSNKKRLLNILNLNHIEINKKLLEASEKHKKEFSEVCYWFIIKTLKLNLYFKNENKLSKFYLIATQWAAINEGKLKKKPVSPENITLSNVKFFSKLTMATVESLMKYLEIDNLHSSSVKTIKFDLIIVKYISFLFEHSCSKKIKIIN